MVLTKPAGSWTYEDLLSLPDDGKRYEIIEGELYEMPAPSLIHAKIVMNLIELLLPIVGRLHGELFTAPVDVFFRGADPVQPDILVLLSGWRGRRARRGPEGAPDLVVEVLSPSNRVHDVLTKRALYARAGVREYWFVDPETRRLDVVSLDADAFQTIATADDIAVSPLLGNAEIPQAAVFAGIDEIEE